MIAAAHANPNAVVANGSDAARYVELRRTSAALFDDALTARSVAGGAELCDADGCAVLGDAVIDGRLVSSLSVDGRPLAGRISGEDAGKFEPRDKST